MSENSSTQNKTSKIIQIAETRYVNHTTGEILQEEKSNIIRLSQEPPFVKLYLEDIARILDLPQGPQSVLLALVRKLDYDGMISLTPTSRERISNTLEIKVVTFNNYLTTLVKKDILRCVGRGEYEMSPHIMAKGDWQSIQKRRSSFKLTVTYNPDGTKAISGQIDNEDLPLETDIIV